MLSARSSLQQFLEIQEWETAGGLVKKQMAAPPPPAAEIVSVGLIWAWEFSFLKNSQEMLKLSLQAPHFENH